VSHGPYLADHNIFASPASVELFSQGGAFVHNLVCGTLALVPVIERPTPYHRPHSTQVAGYAAIYGGDDRYIGNVFLGGDPEQVYAPESQVGHAAGYGTAGYNGRPTSLADYIARVGDPSRGDHERFLDVPQPVYIRDNVYAAGASAFEAERGAVVLGDADVRMTVVDEGDAVYLEAQLPEAFDGARIPMITGRDLERVRFADAEFEERDGSPAVLDTDLVGSARTDEQARPAGPLAALGAGVSRTRVW
jgi:hypothetical protein